jgi:hypothetical protein
MKKQTEAYIAFSFGFITMSVALGIVVVTHDSLRFAAPYAPSQAGFTTSSYSITFPPITDPPDLTTIYSSSSSVDSCTGQWCSCDESNLDCWPYWCHGNPSFTNQQGRDAICGSWSSSSTPPCCCSCGPVDFECIPCSPSFCLAPTPTPTATPSPTPTASLSPSPSDATLPVGAGEENVTIRRWSCRNL